MVTGFEGCDSMKAKSVLTTPHQRIAVFQQKSLRAAGALQTAPNESGRQTKRKRHNGRHKVFFIPVLMQTHTCTCLVAVDQTYVGLKIPVSCIAGSALRKRQQR